MMCVRVKYYMCKETKYGNFYSFPWHIVSSSGAQRQRVSRYVELYDERQWQWCYSKFNLANLFPKLRHTSHPGNPLNESYLICYFKCFCSATATAVGSRDVLIGGNLHQFYMHSYMM